MQTISFRSASAPFVRPIGDEPEPRVSADAQKRRRGAMAIVDGLISVTPQAWHRRLSTLLDNEGQELN
jgi:hypothetical protein